MVSHLLLIVVYIVIKLLFNSQLLYRAAFSYNVALLEGSFFSRKATHRGFKATHRDVLPTAYQ